MDKKAIIAIILVVALVAVGTIMVWGMNPSGEMTMVWSRS